MLSEALQAITEEEMRTGNNLTPCSLCAVSLLCNIATEKRKNDTKHQLNMFELLICSTATFEEYSHQKARNQGHILFYIKTMTVAVRQLNVHPFFISLCEI